MNKVTSESGVWPPPEREILIERAALSVIDAQIGDVVLVRFPNDVERRIRIAGTAYDPAQLPAQIDGTPYGYITFDTLEWFGEPYGFNELHVLATHPEDKDWAQQVVNRVKDKAEKSGYTIPLSMTAEPGQLPMDDVLQGILLLMGVLGVLSLFLSIFLVVNTVSALLTQQKRQIGVMKAVGGSTLQILGMYLVMVLAYGVMALLIAIPLGMYGARELSSALAVFFNFDIYSMEVPPQTFLIQIAIGLILPVLASLVPFISNLRISAAEAMSMYTMSKGRFGKNWIDQSALRREFMVHAEILHPLDFVIGEEHLPQQGQVDPDLDHAHVGLGYLHQRFQYPRFAVKHGRRYDQVVQLRYDAHP